MPPRPMRGKYLGFVAHEIKNPLAAALWSCDLLKRMEPADRAGARAEKMIDVSLRALRRMRRLVDDFFTIERILEHGYELKRENVGLKDLVEPAMHALAEKDGVSTESWVLELDEVSTVGDVEMLRRAVRLLLEHMARASPHPHLSISGRADAENLALHIRADAAPKPLIPPAPEERPSGDPTGGVLGFELATHILASQGGRVEERDGGLWLVFPRA